MEKKPILNDRAVPAVRARGIIKNLTPAALLATITLASARANWDDRYVSGGVLERYNQRTHKFCTVQKGGILVSERDIVGVQAVVSPEGEAEKGFEVVQMSVEGDPENSGRVRATVTYSGWSVVPRGDDLDVVYVMKSEYAGPLHSDRVTPRYATRLSQWIQMARSHLRSSGRLCKASRRL
jgi:hypothetical protein